MKKLLIALVCMVAMATNGNAQVNPHALGVRGGSGNFGFGGEISYQHGLGDANRLELDLGWRGNSGNNSRHIGITGIYHWVWNITSGLNWYVGPGAQVGLYNNSGVSNEDGITLALGGQLGLEYDFNHLGAPILLGLDTRPMWGFIGGGSGLGYGGAFSLRFTF